MADADDPTCWICLDSLSPADDRLIRPCSCPRVVHEQCLGRWQLQNVGQSEELVCRFCDECLPDWRATIGRHARKAAPIMTIDGPDGRPHQIIASSGALGRMEFAARIRSIFKLADNEEPSLTFTLRLPGSGEIVELKGWEAFDAAVHCASCCAGERASPAIASQPPQPRTPERSLEPERRTWAARVKQLWRESLAVQQHVMIMTPEGRIRETRVHY